MNLLLSSIIFSIFFFVNSSHALAADYAASRGQDAGDHLRLLNDVYGFIPLSTAPGVGTEPRCAGKNTSFSEINTTDTETFVKFYSVHEPLREALINSLSENRLCYKSRGYKRNLRKS